MPDPLPVVRRLPRGSGVIVRHTDPRARRKLAETLMPLCRARGLICVIAEDWRLAAALRADGVHLPERAAIVGIGAAARLWRRRTRRLLTVAAHGARALRRAKMLGADAAILARAFPSPSHPGAPALGPLRFAILARRSTTPVVALGGITVDGAKRLRGSGAVGIAAIGALI